MSNISNLRNILFDQLERLNKKDITAEELDIESHRTAQMVMISNEIIDAGRAEIEFLRLEEELTKNSNFFVIQETKAIK